MNPFIDPPDEAREALDIIRQVGGDDLVRTLMRTFVVYTDAQLARADSAVHAGDAVELARLAHSLKSSARQLGAIAFADACAAVETAGAESRDPARAIAGVPDMQREYVLARRWLNAMAATA